MVQLLQSTMRLLECPWLQQQHKSSVESCIRTLAMVGKEPLLCPGDRGQGHPGLCLPSLSLLWGWQDTTVRGCQLGLGTFSSGICFFLSVISARPR